MSGRRSQIPWNSLVNTLETAKYGPLKNHCPPDASSETSSRRSGRSNTSPLYVSSGVRTAIRTLDHKCCFVTNEASDTEVAHLMDNSNADNRQLVDALHGLGIVSRSFNFAHLSNLILMSRRLHHLWDKYAAFIIVPSTDTRKQMIEILIDDRERISLALTNKEAVEPRQLAYPELVAYDIILVQPSLFGGEQWSFQRADNRGEIPTHYTIPAPSSNLRSCLEYLIRQDDGAHVSEFLNISHATGRSSQEVVNPYLMVMNALPKLKHWDQWGIEETSVPTSVPNPVFTTAFEDCQEIKGLISMMIGGDISMSRVIHDAQANGSKGDDLSDADEGGGDKTPSNSTMDLAEEPESHPGSDHAHHDPSRQPAKQSWISRGNFEKESCLENWRQEVRELGHMFPLNRELD